MLMSTNFCFQMFVDNAQQCFACTPQSNIPTHNLNFHWRWRWWHWIQAIFLNLFYFNSTHNYKRFVFSKCLYGLAYWGLLTRLRQVTVIGDVVLLLLVWGCWGRRRWHLNRHLWVLIASEKYIYVSSFILYHTTYSWSIKWQKCADMGLNGFILKKINENENIKTKQKILQAV